MRRAGLTHLAAGDIYLSEYTNIMKGKSGENMEEYTLVRSRRKTLSMQVTRELEVVVRAPKWLPKREIDAFVKSREGWIVQHKARQAARNAAEALSEEEEVMLRTLAGALLPRKAAAWGKRMELCPASVRVTGARTRFGSCSGENRICFSWRLLRYPETAIDYVVVHELAHIRHKNHGTAFYEEIEQVLPDYREWEQLLRQPPMLAAEAIPAAEALLTEEAPV